MEKNTSKVLASDPDIAATLMTAGAADPASGAQLFIINLCASMAPIPNVGKSLPGLEGYRLYQVTRREDGRTRYRLRLGFFTSEEDAEAILATVRATYPTAFTACLGDEDAKFARGYVPEPPRTPKIQVVDTKPPAPPAPPKPAPSVASDQIKVATPAAAKAAQPTTPARAAPASASAVKASPPQPAAAQPAAPKPAASDVTEIELSWDPPQLATQAPASQPPAAQAATPAPAAQTIAPGFKTQDVIKAAPAAAATSKAATKPAAGAASKPATQAAPEPSKIAPPSQLRASIELSLEQEPVAAPKQPETAPSNEPFRVSRGAKIPATSLTLESSATAQAAAPATKPAPAAAKPPLSTAAEMSRLKAAHAAAPASIKAALAPGGQTGKLPDLDSTQTIRALTNDELADESQEKWFAIQLAVSDQPVNLDTMPRLDIFEAYRLYSVALAGSGKITHSLRIGFFREEVSAEAVCGYLTTFFNSPSVVRISIAEHARFKDPPAPKPAPKTAEVLDLSHARDRTAKPIPTVTMEVETPRFDPNATGSFRTSTTGMHKALASGSHKALAATGAHRTLGATGTHKTLKAASKTARPPTKRSAPLSKTSATGKHRSLQPKKSLEQQLLEEAREVELSESGIRKLPKNDSLLSKMFGRLTK